MIPLGALLLAWVPGGTELIVILVIVLIIFGVGKLPEVGRGLGKGIKEFKDATQNSEIEAPKAEKSASTADHAAAEKEEVSKKNS